MEIAKNIIAKFLKVKPSEIKKNTIIDSSAIRGSVLIHRMYSELSSEGYHIEKKGTVKTYGDFLNILNQETVTDLTDTPLKTEKKVTVQNTLSDCPSNILIGIDIEDINNMPEASDYRANTFYTDNFSSNEISYCILQADPRGSFAGKFSLKEAIIKADNSYKSVPFKNIEILNNDLGKPLLKDFSLSISHTNNQAVAVAVKGSILVTNEPPTQRQITKDGIKDLILQTNKTGNYKKNNKISYLSFILSIISIFSVIYLYFIRQ